MKQEEDKIFISQDKLGMEIFKKFKMEDYKMEDYIKMNTPVEYEVKMSRLYPAAFFFSSTIEPC